MPVRRPAARRRLPAQDLELRQDRHDRRLHPQDPGPEAHRPEPGAAEGLDLAVDPPALRADGDRQRPARRGGPLDPDANGTLRVTFGNVTGYAPRDAVVYRPFTTAAGVAQKATGEPPFDAPPELLEAIATRDYGSYAADGKLAVNFLSDVDTTGGNSGSATLDAKGRLVGLLFDGNWESMISDWDFLPEVTRSIHVDVRYMLWVMDRIDGADPLLEEMGVDPAFEEAAR
mgnify:CR=1 FL=1